MVHLIKQNSYVIVSPEGGRITQLWLNSQPILWSGLRPDGKPASTHVCLPNFRRVRTGALKDLPQHGPARSATWQVVKLDPITLSWRMDKLSNIYPAGLQAVQIMQLAPDRFDYTLKLTNTAGQAVPVNPGVHFYFTGGIKAKVKVNDRLIPANLWLGDGSLFPIKAKNLIEFSWGQIKLDQTGFKSFMLWSPQGAEFVCIEPINGVDDDIYLKSNQLLLNQSRTWHLSIKLV